jgi:hypothetical protein
LVAGGDTFSEHFGTPVGAGAETAALAWPFYLMAGTVKGAVTQCPSPVDVWRVPDDALPAAKQEPVKPGTCGWQGSQWTCAAPL